MNAAGAAGRRRSSVFHLLHSGFNFTATETPDAVTFVAAVTLRFTV